MQKFMTDEKVIYNLINVLWRGIFSHVKFENYNSVALT